MKKYQSLSFRISFCDNFCLKRKEILAPTQSPPVPIATQPKEIAP